MNRSTSFLRTSFISMPLLAGAVLATGCMDTAEPTTNTGEHAIVNQAGLSPVAPIGEVRVAGGRISLASPEWAQTGPGTWASSSKDGAGSIIIGAEGHRAAIAKSKTDLAALRANGGSTEAIEQQEAYLGSLETAAGAGRTRSGIGRSVPAGDAAHEASQGRMGQASKAAGDNGDVAAPDPLLDQDGLGSGEQGREPTDSADLLDRSRQGRQNVEFGLKWGMTRLRGGFVLAPLGKEKNELVDSDSVLGFNLNKLMNGLAERRRVVLVG